MTLKFATALTAILTFSICATCRADEILLKNGNIISGKVVASDESGITVKLTLPSHKEPGKTRDVEVRFPSNAIQQIKRSANLFKKTEHTVFGKKEEELQPAQELDDGGIGDNPATTPGGATEPTLAPLPAPKAGEPASQLDQIRQAIEKIKKKIREANNTIENDPLVADAMAAVEQIRKGVDEKRKEMEDARGDARRRLRSQLDDAQRSLRDAQKNYDEKRAMREAENKILPQLRDQLAQMETRLSILQLEAQ